jgi:hypothetical protein
LLAASTHRCSCRGTAVLAKRSSAVRHATRFCFTEHREFPVAASVRRTWL